MYLIILLLLSFVNGLSKARTSYMSQSTLPVVNLNNSAYYDDDGNAMALFAITSLPSVGNLYVNNNQIISANTIINATDTLRYDGSVPPYFFSITGNASCNSVSAYDTFLFKASDGLCNTSSIPLCYSPVSATAFLCVADVERYPVSSNISLSVSLGRSVMFEITATDNNDPPLVDAFGSLSVYRFRDAVGANSYAPNSSVVFATTTSSKGKLVGALTATSCGTTPLAANTSLSWQTFSGVKRFLYCYVPTLADNGLPIVGNDSFLFVVKDTFGGASLSSYAVSVSITSPLEVCPTAGYTNIGQTAVCDATGLETTSSPNSEQIIPLYLQGRDNTPGSTMTFQIVSLPKYGSLYYNIGGSTPTKGNLTKVNGTVAVSTTNNPNLLYVGFPNYFNQMGTTLTNLNGLGFDGCSGILASCRCNLTVNPLGCPDSFSYVTRGTLAGVVSKGAVGTYNIHVNGILSPFGLNFSDVSVPMGIRTNIPIPVQVVDYDDSGFWMGIKVLTSAELPGIAPIIEVTQLSSPAIYTDDYSCTNYYTYTCSEMEFIGTSYQLNAYLATLLAKYIGLDNQTMTVAFTLVDNLINDHDINGLFTAVSDGPNVKGSVAIYTQPLPPDTSNANAFFAIFVTIGAIGGLLLLALFCVGFYCVYRAAKTIASTKINIDTKTEPGTQKEKKSLRRRGI